MQTFSKTAKRKVLKPRWWESEREITVYLDPTPGVGGYRRFEVFAEEGSYLGFIDEFQGRVTTKITGTRLVRHGKRRTFWAVNGTKHWQQHPSQADAIRKLIDQRNAR